MVTRQVREVGVTDLCPVEPQVFQALQISKMGKAVICDPATGEADLLDPAQPGNLCKDGIIDFGSPDAHETHGLKVVLGHQAEEPPRSRVRGLWQQAPGERPAEPAIDKAAGMSNLPYGGRSAWTPLSHQAMGRAATATRAITSLSVTRKRCCGQVPGNSSC